MTNIKAGLHQPNMRKQLFQINLKRVKPTDLHAEEQLFEASAYFLKTASEESYARR